MKEMKRLYQDLVTKHLKEYRQMIFLAGPRQVGKTTTSLNLKDLAKHFYYLNWDNQNDRETIISGPQKVAEKTKLSELKKRKNTHHLR